jgi:hypothetical protein
MFGPFDFVLALVSAGTDLETACRIEGVKFERFVTALDRDNGLRRQWTMAEALWRMVQRQKAVTVSRL